MDRPVAGALQQDVVEEVLGLDHRQRVRPVGGGHDPRDVLVRGAQRADLRLRRVLHEPARGERLERGTHLVQLGGILGCRDRDDRPALRDGRDEPLGGELAEHLADRGARHADLLDELALDEPLARLEPVLDDRVAQQVQDLLAKGAATRWTPSDSPLSSSPPMPMEVSVTART